MTLSMVEIYNEAVRSGLLHVAFSLPLAQVLSGHPLSPLNQILPSFSLGTFWPQGLQNAWQ